MPFLQYLQYFLAVMLTVFSIELFRVDSKNDESPSSLNSLVSIVEESPKEPCPMNVSQTTFVEVGDKGGEECECCSDLILEREIDAIEARIEQLLQLHQVLVTQPTTTNVTVNISNHPSEARPVSRDTKTVKERSCEIESVRTDLIGAQNSTIQMAELVNPCCCPMVPFSVENVGRRQVGYCTSRGLPVSPAWSEFQSCDAPFVVQQQAIQSQHEVMRYRHKERTVETNK